MRIQDIIRRPLLSEKTTDLREMANTYAFEVASAANKIEIRRAIEHQFGVRVAEVRIANVHGKTKRQGRFVGRRRDWKKAYVRLVDGEKTIEFFDGV